MQVVYTFSWKHLVHSHPYCSCKNQRYKLTCLYTNFLEERLKESAILKVILDDDIRDRVKHELDIVSIGCTCKMCVDFLCVFSFVKVFKLQLNVGGSFFISIRPCAKNANDVKR